MFAAFPFAAVPFAATLSLSLFVDSGVDRSTLVDDATCLVEIEIFQGASSGSAVLPPWEGFSTTPFASAAFGASIPVSAAKLYYSDNGWIGEPGDPDKPNALYDARVLVPFQFERDAPIFPEQTRRLQVQYGQTILAAGDAVLDSIVKNNPVAGRSLKVYRGKRAAPFSTPYASHSLVLSALVTSWQQDENHVSIDLRDTAYKLELPLQSTLYGGTGGIEGDAQFAGKPKPICLGFKRNISPDLIDQANLIYCFHFREVQAVTAARDLGAALSAGSDYPDYGSLVAASVGAGTYSTCLGLGLIKVGTKPTGLTVDVQGDSHGVYTDTHAGIARKILLDLAGLTNSDFLSSSFAAWPLGTAGIYFGSDATLASSDAMDQVAASIAGWWGPQRNGVLVAGQLFDPNSMNVDLYIGLSDITGPVETMPMQAQPRYRQRVGYEAIQVVQNDAGLAGSVSAADRAFYSQAYRSVTSIDTAIQQRYPLATDFPVLVTLFDASGPAQTLADTLLGLHKLDRRMFKIPLGPLGFVLDLGKVVNVTYPRFDLAGQSFIVVGTIEDASGVTIIVWG